ncbi:MAG: hypothetical protein L6R38_003989 [Xanthoria sp. 2 TBL-2021]|nr:MAG: hypothetical protein L6R38_003989 [Xanthoria sp. 2 TBL-2021]
MSVTTKPRQEVEGAGRAVDINPAKQALEAMEAAIQARRAQRAKDQGYASLQEYDEATQRFYDERRVKQKILAKEHWDEAVRSGRDLEREDREDRERALEEEEKRPLPWYLPEKCRCDGRSGRLRAFDRDADKGADHLTLDFCEGNLKSPQGSMDGVSDHFREQMRPRLENVVIDEWRPSNRFTEANLQRVWSHDSENERSDCPLPYWTDRDPIVQHLIAQRSLKKIEDQRGRNLSGDDEIEIPSDSKGHEGRMDSNPRRIVPYETNQSIGKRGAREREENDSMSDSSDSKTDARRVKARIDERQIETYRRTTLVRGSNQTSAAYLPRAASQSRPFINNFPGNSKAKTAISRMRLPQSPLLGSANGDARPAAPANPFKRLRDTLATERMDEEARTPFPFAGTGGQVVDMDTSSPPRIFNISTSPLSGSGPLKRNRNTLAAEGDSHEERAPKRLRGTPVQGNPQQHHPTENHRPVARRARQTGYSSSRKQARNTESAGIQATGPQSPSSFAERLQPPVDQDSLRSQVSRNTRAPDQPADVVNSILEDVEAQIRSLEAKKARAHALQRLEALQREEARGFSIQQDPDHRQNVPGAASLKRGRGSQTDEEAHDEAGASVSPAKKLRRTDVSARSTAIPTNRSDAAMTSSTIQERDVEEPASVDDSATVLTADEAAAGPAAAGHSESVLEPRIRETKRSRGVMKGRVKKNPPAGGKGVPSKTKARAKTKTAAVISPWLKSLLENPRQTRSQKRKVFVELDAQSQVIPVRGRLGQFKAVMIPATRPSRAK